MVTDDGTINAGHNVYVRRFGAGMFSITHPNNETECIMYINPMVILEQETLICPHCGFKGKLINGKWLPE